jgi:hypothetical protein
VCLPRHRTGTGQVARVLMPDRAVKAAIGPGRVKLDPYRPEFVQPSMPGDVAWRLEGKLSLGRLGLLTNAPAGWIDPGFSSPRHAGAVQRRDAGHQAVARMTIGQLYRAKLSDQDQGSSGFEIRRVPVTLRSPHSQPLSRQIRTGRVGRTCGCSLRARPGQRSVLPPQPPGTPQRLAGFSSR